MRLAFRHKIGCLIFEIDDAGILHAYKHFIKLMPRHGLLKFCTPAVTAEDDESQLVSIIYAESLSERAYIYNGNSRRSQAKYRSIYLR